MRAAVEAVGQHVIRPVANVLPGAPVAQSPFERANLELAQQDSTTYWQHNPDKLVRVRLRVEEGPYSQQPLLPPAGPSDNHTGAAAAAAAAAAASAPVDISLSGLAGLAVARQEVDTDVSSVTAASSGHSGRLPVSSAPGSPRAAPPAAARLKQGSGQGPALDAGQESYFSANSGTVSTQQPSGYLSASGSGATATAGPASPRHASLSQFGPASPATRSAAVNALAEHVPSRVQLTPDMGAFAGALDVAQLVAGEGQRLSPAGLTQSGAAMASVPEEPVAVAAAAAPVPKAEGQAAPPVPLFSRLRFKGLSTKKRGVKDAKDRQVGRSLGLEGPVGRVHRVEDVEGAQCGVLQRSLGSSVLVFTSPARCFSMWYLALSSWRAVACRCALTLDHLRSRPPPRLFSSSSSLLLHQSSPPARPLSCRPLRPQHRPRSCLHRHPKNPRSTFASG